MRVDLSQLKQKHKFFLACAIVSFAVFTLVFIFAPLTKAPFPQIVEISKGSTLNQAASLLKDRNLIYSEFVFKALVVLQGGKRNIVAGDYYFTNPHGTASLARRFVKGNFGLELEKITIPEGLTNKQIANLFKLQFSLFDDEYFLKNAPQGYLFPDTYSFFPNVSAKSVIGRMQDVFSTKTERIKNDATVLKRNFANIVILASILEEEAKPEDMKMVSGVLANRLAINMPLQVDAATSTYKSKGIPLVPISNPGLDALEAALYPTKNDYLYYLSDLKGKIYYAKTFDEHQTNRELYLNK